MNVNDMMRYSCFPSNGHVLIVSLSLHMHTHTYVHIFISPAS